MQVGTGWAQNSVNTTIFRKNSVVSDQNRQYAAYYDESGHVVIAHRNLDSEDWTAERTQLTGNMKDAHNSICIAVDGDGFLHIAWDHHNTSLHYAKSTKPGSLEFAEIPSMIGSEEHSVTYPEFYSIAGGDLIFLYRDGGSGRGNLVMNRYHTASKTWSRVQTKLIDGENKRNSYWQAYVDPNSESIYLSWTWRETWDVSTNHDICFAKSSDGGKSWVRSDGTPYVLPITAATAEYAALIPQNSELINQTSMCSDSDGNPYIASYWTPAGSKVPQFHLVHYDGYAWHNSQITKRETPFSLSGTGTKKIPISRPQILADSTGDTTKAYLIFRDIERDNRPSMAYCDDISSPEWKFKDLAEIDTDQWEPSYDLPLWSREKKLALFIQRTAQGDGYASEGQEKTVELPPQPVYVLQWQDSR